MQNSSAQLSTNTTLVMKFGGTSVGTPEAMAKTVEIIREQHNKWVNLVVITSALSGVTNMLLNSVEHAVRGDFQFSIEQSLSLKRLHEGITEKMIPDPDLRIKTNHEISALISEFSSLVQAIAILEEATPRVMDAIAALGERMSVRLLSSALVSAGISAEFIEATRLIQTDEQFQNAHPNLIETQKMTHEVLDPILARKVIPVITGFIGSSRLGVTTTLGRGGSDYSAGIIGAVLQANDVWIWTDVDGVMSADPRLVSDARTIPAITYREIAELSYYGAKVLHPKTIRPLVDAGIGLRICNTFNPNHPGTRLILNTSSKPEKWNGGEIIKAVTVIRNQSLVTVEGRGMLGVPGVAAKTFGAVASTGTSVPLITQASSEQSICFAIPTNRVDQIITALELDFSRELANHDIDRIWATSEVSIITVVGEGMIHTPGIAGAVFTILGEMRINVIAIAQGSSEVSISLVVDDKDTEIAVKALHRLIARAKDATSR